MRKDRALMHISTLAATQARIVAYAFALPLTGHYTPPTDEAHAGPERLGADRSTHKGGQMPHRRSPYVGFLVMS